jgi:hypothetical protein
LDRATIIWRSGAVASRMNKIAARATNKITSRDNDSILANHVRHFDAEEPRDPRCQPPRADSDSQYKPARGIPRGPVPTTRLRD